MAGRGGEQRCHLAEAQHQQVGVVVGQVRVGVEPGVDHPLPQQLQRSMGTHMVKGAEPPPRGWRPRQGLAPPVAGLEPQTAAVAQAVELLHVALEQQQIGVPHQVLLPQAPLQREFKKVESFAHVAAHGALAAVEGHGRRRARAQPEHMVEGFGGGLVDQGE